jgi:hypothetical protein
MKKNLAVWTLFGLALVINPNLACSSSEDEEEFSYSEQDMKAAVLGDWVGTAELEGESYPVSLTLVQASSGSRTQSISAPVIRPQCAQRSFVKAAGACASLSTMPLGGTIASENPTLNGDVTGDAMAGLNLISVGLHLQIADGHDLTGRVADEALGDGEIYAEGKVGTFTLARP